MYSKNQIQLECGEYDARQDTAEPVLRDQILKRKRGQGNIHFPRSADHEQIGNRLIYTLLYEVCDDYVCMYIWSHIGRCIDKPGKAANLARGQLNRENVFFPVGVCG